MGFKLFFPITSLGKIRILTHPNMAFFLSVKIWCANSFLFLQWKAERKKCCQTNFSG